MRDLYYCDNFKNNILKSILSSIKLEWRSPTNLIFYLNSYRHQIRAAQKRRRNRELNINIPPILIVSITDRCNLNCTGCYAMAKPQDKTKELSVAQLSDIFQQADDLGSSIIMLAGGEPLLRPKILELAANFRNILFPVFTNGTLIDNSTVTFFKQNKNMIPLLSIEGRQDQTNHRRGPGVHEQIIEKAKMMERNKIHFGFSLTLTSQNYDNILEANFVKAMSQFGSKIHLFVEYVPQSKDDLDLCLTSQQKANLSNKLRHYKIEFDGIYTALPGDEEQYGGCLAAGRGFLHINSKGDVEPCPFTPYSDTNLKEVSLQEALASNFLKKLQKQHGKLSESKGGCTLWENRDWVEQQLK